MAGKSNKYNIVARYMSGAEVTGYHLQSAETNVQKRYTRDQVAYLVGKGQIENCSGQLYQGKLILRGVNISLDNLPVYREDATTGHTENSGKAQRGVKSDSATRAGRDTPKRTTGQPVNPNSQRIANFKVRCKETFDSVNRGTGNKLKSLGFTDGDGESNLVRFDFGIQDQATEFGGFIELDPSGALSFNVTRADGDIDTGCFDHMRDGIIWQVDFLKQQRLIR